MTSNTDNAASTPAGSPVGWFEIGTDDPDTARSFYGTVFGWTFAVDGPYSVVTTGPGEPLQGGIQDTTGPLPEGQQGTTYAVPCLVVPDVAASCARVEEHGGKVVIPATPVPTGLVYGMITDPAGNKIGLFTPPELPAN